MAELTRRNSSLNRPGASYAEDDDYPDFSGALCSSSDYVAYPWLEDYRGKMRSYIHVEMSKVCRQCPVMDKCAAYALKHPMVGFWGGMTDQERRAIRGARGLPNGRDWHWRNMRVDRD